MRSMAPFLAVVLSASFVQGVTKAKRINKAIELLEQAQPVYYTATRGGYEEGKELGQTWADYVNYELEHGAFDMTKLREFMRGLVDGGPTESGHRTPAVIVSLPVLGLDEASMRANSWVVQQVLAAGVHGVLLCHARSPEAVRVFVQAARYPFHPQAVGSGLEEGLRGSGSQDYAAGIWGISTEEYLRLADPWPLNPEGEILLGLKIEDRHALENAELSTKIPGIGFAEWGPGDMGFSYGFKSRQPGPWPTVMQEARARVLEATRSAGIYFLNAVNPDNVEAMIDEGVMIGSGNREAAEKGRRYSKRPRPW
ncbi:MAG TPA: aldolase/citrate lyase family protein [Vicinamibacteria bacterium]|nr:aldolase/citrate lyase family protein [Vicinamibacteria bacterium]